MRISRESNQERKETAKEKKKSKERAENSYTDRIEATGHRSNIATKSNIDQVKTDKKLNE